MNRQGGVKVSVVLSAYNGERFIVEQLESLRLQSLQPDEVIIADDGSTDGTLNLVREFVAANGLNTWHVRRNDGNLGWKRSFYNLLLEATGSYVFPCDQDDIWHPGKIEAMCAVMDTHSEVDVLACSVAPLYEQGAMHTAAASREVSGCYEDALSMRAPDERFMYVERPGCSYCVRGSFIDEVAPYLRPDWPHDAQLWRFASLKGSLALLDKRLVDFRRHADNASSRRPLTRSSRMADVEYYVDSLNEILRYSDDAGNATNGELVLLEKILDWLERRASYLSHGGIIRAWALIARRRYYITGRGLLVDLMLGWRPGMRTRG